MGLVSTQAHLLGRDVKSFIERETAMGTFIKATTAGSLNGIFRMTPNDKRKDRIDSYMASRDVVERITDKTEHSWEYMESFYVPSGTKNVAPDVGSLIRSAMGAETVGSNDVTYTLDSVQTLKTLSITQQVEEEFQENMAGCFVDSLTMKFAGGEEPKISASGRGMTYSCTGRSTLNGAMASSTTMIVQTADANAFATNIGPSGVAGSGAHSVIKIHNDDNSSTGHEVTVDSAAPSFTIAAAATGSDTQPVIPFVPTHTDAGSPISGVSGTFTWDSFSARIMSLEFTINNAVKYFDDEAFVRHLSDGIPLLREITGTMSFRVRRDHLIYIQNRKDFTTVALSLAVGGAAQSGTRLQVSMPYVVAEFSAIEIPETEEATYSLPFRAIGSAGNDALTIVHT